MKLRSLGVLALLTALLIAAEGFAATSLLRVSKVSMMVPAVYVGADGRLHGVISNLTVLVLDPGSGSVYMSVEPLTQIDTQASARVAALVASMLAGVAASSRDYALRLEAPSPVVGGPSASGAMAVAILAALRGVPVPANVSMTGMICPDGTLGPVGGIPEKLRAAARAGARLFVVPRGQLVVRDPFTGRTVDVSALGATLGVKVVEAGTVVEAYELITGDKLAVKPSTLAYPSWLADSLHEALRTFADIARSNITCAKKLEVKLEGASLRIVDETVSEAERALREAFELEAKGKLYAAASKAFYAAFRAGYACALATALSSSEPAATARSIVESLVREAATLVSSATRAYNRAVAAGLTDVRFQLLVTAYDRLRDANYSLSSIPYAESTLEALQSAVYAKLRALTALLWSETALKASGGRDVKPAALSKAVYGLLRYAETVAAYLSALTGARVGLGTLAEASEELRKGDLIAAASLTVESIARLAVELHRAFGTAETLVNSAAKMARILASKLAAMGVQPLLPVAYVELGDQLSNPLERLAAYESSASYSLMLYMLVPAKQAPPTVPTVTVTKTETRTVTVTREEVVTMTETTTIRTTVVPSHLVAGAALCGFVIGFVAAMLALRRAGSKQF